MDIFSKENRSKIMASIKSRGTSIEEKFRIALCENKIKGYRINPRMDANPDFAFTKYKIAIFCDGDFWHGRDYRKIRKRLKKRFWRDKIETNMRRDKKHDKLLRKNGWTVLRFWESDINENIKKCINELRRELSKKKK